MSYNPWSTKNPLLSLWLSGANAVFGASRNQATAAMHRQMNAAMTQGTRHMLALWGITTPGRSYSGKRRRR